MDIYWYVIVFIFGAIIGSFLNVVIYRLHTGRSLRGRSHCLSCGVFLSWYELFPIVSYIFQRAKCRNCTAYIPSRYLVVELLTALSFIWLWSLYSTNLLLFIGYAVLIATLIVIAVYDIRHTIIPDELSFITGALAVLLLLYEFSFTGDFIALTKDLGAGAIAGVFIGALWYLSRGRWMGLGDAKLALPLGIIAGYPLVFSMIILSFWVGTVVSLLLLISERLYTGTTRLRYLSAPITIKSEVPFAPFLIAGFLLAHFLHADVFYITFFLMPFSV